MWGSLVLLGLSVTVIILLSLSGPGEDVGGGDERARERGELPYDYFRGEK